MNEHTTSSGAAFELRLRSLFHEGRALAFPCDAGGQVDIETLSPRARENFMRAIAAVGRDYALPAVEPRALH